MADLVIDEWLWSDLSGENKAKNPNSQSEAFQFLEAVFKKCDRFVIVVGSRFDQKAIELWSRGDRIRCNLARFWKDSFRFNSNKSVLLEEWELQELPPELADQVNLDDRYLVRALLTSNASAFITTDNKLRIPLLQRGLPCHHRKDFVPNYILQYGRK